MKKLLILVGLVAFSASAGEVLLGILHPKGNSTSNQGLWLIGSTDGGSAFASPTKIFTDAGLIDGGFYIPALDKVTVQCGAPPDGGSANDYVCADRAICTSSSGLQIIANQALPTSTGAVTVTQASPSQPTAVISIYSPDDNTCLVFERNGKE